MPLKATQRWLQSAITSVPAPASVERHIAASPLLAPAERLAVYRELYPGRLVSALKVDYPLLHQHLGGEAFTRLALRYAQANPSRAFTLNQFGAGLPEFIVKPALAQDIARFERTTSVVFHAAEAAPLTEEAIAAVPTEAWEQARLNPIPALRLLALRHPVQQLAEGQPSVVREATWLAVYRRNYEVGWLPLTKPAHAVLAALCSGKALGEALAGQPAGIASCFRDWTAAGLFSGVELAQAHSRKKSR